MTTTAANAITSSATAAISAILGNIKYDILARSQKIPELELQELSELKRKKLLSIIIPVFNEANTVDILLKKIYDKELTNLNKEIIIIESNSEDGTREKILKYQNKPNVKIILEDRARGKGHAVRQGLLHASGDFIIIQDGDLEYDLNDYDQLLEPLIKEENTFVLGSRHVKGGKIRQFETQPIRALIMNWGHIFFTFIFNFFCKSNLKDPFTMFKVFRRDCIYNINFSANRFDFDWELVIKLLRKGYLPIEIPVNYKSRSFVEGKKIMFFKDSISWIIGVVKFRFGRLYVDKY
ncbi:MAG: glycosyltransferase family 2 protein [Oligoflexia bacterium]|nr:glycosyltransferase family 2 protein [Oligoflexia bacterium]